ncbi:MAG TPA: PH domain-containing protein [Gammaproteobacteria bacterium]|nr:PH domain-containing protein [Gammaproteobacteria bacterium]
MAPTIGESAAAPTGHQPGTAPIPGQPAAAPTEDWQRLSPWAIVHLLVSGVVRHAQALLFGLPAIFGVSLTRFEALAWQIPAFAGCALGVSAILQFAFTRYRVTDSAVVIQRGALFRRRVNLGFERIQDVRIAEPFYFRPLRRANLSIDSAGSAQDEIEIAALSLSQADALRSWLSAMRERRLLAGARGATAFAADPSRESTDDSGRGHSHDDVGELFFTRKLRDLVIYGLTNNRAFIVVAGLMGLFWQTGVSTSEIVDFLGIDFDVIVAGLSLVRFAILLLLAFVVSIGLLALLSVLVSIVSYHGFAMYRTAERLIVRRGLLNRHEIAVRKSRIQTVRLSQDWLDHLLERRNIYLEQLTHAPHGHPAARKHVMVPSVRLQETAQVTDEVWPIAAVEGLKFTPYSRRWFRKHAIIVTLLELAVVGFLLTLNRIHPGLTIAAAAALWPALIAAVYQTWKRGGLAVVGDMVVARSGTIGINYRIFPTAKLQDIAHVQTPFMRRRDVSTLVFMTASSKITVPYLPREFARRVVDYCLYAVEVRPTSWM